MRVKKPDGTIVVTPDYNIQDLPADVTRKAPMYSDLHQKHVAVKGLGVGDTLEYQVTLRTLKPEVPGQFWLEYTFEKNTVVLDEQLDLDLPADKHVTVASADAQPTITTSDGRKLYHWASANLARPDPDAPPKSHKALEALGPGHHIHQLGPGRCVVRGAAEGCRGVTPAIQAQRRRAHQRPHHATTTRCAPFSTTWP